jgi:hypothetical protein
MIKVNGVDIATPKVLAVDIQDIDGDSERNANGDLLRDRITTKQKINCEWGPLTNSEISTLLQAVQDVFFDVTYPDPFAGTYSTKNMYVGNRPSQLYKNGLWENLKMSFIER